MLKDVKSYAASGKMYKFTTLKTQGLILSFFACKCASSLSLIFRQTK